MNQFKKVALIAIFFAVCLSACGRRGDVGLMSFDPNDPNQPMDYVRGVATSLDGLQGQSAVPGEYIIKRKGHSFITPPEEFGINYGLLFVADVENLGIELFQISADTDLEALKASSDIEFIHPNHIRTLSAQQQAMAKKSVARNQSRNRYQSQSNRVRTMNGGLNQTYVGLIDSGVDSSDPALQGKIVPGHNVFGSDDFGDDNGHGTATASGAIAQARIQGVDPNSQILPVKAFNSSGLGTDFGIAEGISWAIDHGAKVLVVSAIGQEQSGALSSAFELAQKRNVPIISSSGSPISGSVSSMSRMNANRGAANRSAYPSNQYSSYNSNNRNYNSYNSNTAYGTNRSAYPSNQYSSYNSNNRNYNSYNSNAAYGTNRSAYPSNQYSSYNSNNRNQSYNSNAAYGTGRSAYPSNQYSSYNSNNRNYQSYNPSYGNNKRQY